MIHVHFFDNMTYGYQWLIVNGVSPYISHITKYIGLNVIDTDGTSNVIDTDGTSNVIDTDGTSKVIDTDGTSNVIDSDVTFGQGKDIVVSIL
jgi:hypothetical protein